ncbi:hypothetical protein [Ulvibacter litoralis]|uniref:Uncharacterized protein n=1 Tax=Ulvibacter litoralis TaxID=227084 RepID=A0A1G7C3F1_9FLAO|nr:hypothetical protein [Ulvibacter litoralis]GHC48800.1 hypothetical protein GCM10008083_10260 [Ulvibacter litoralis]SDE33827.1 hypothetical protein SAMN05421855_101161 [Ulvibacter litoralis]
MNDIIIILTGILGATLTFYVSKRLNQGAVRASALLSLLVGLFFYVFPNLLNDYLTKNIQIVFIGASFIGMVSSKNGSYTRLIVAGSIFSVIYINKSSFFDGYGGAIGTLALIALLASMTFSDAFSSSPKIAHAIVRVRKKIFNQKK